MARLGDHQHGLADTLILPLGYETIEFRQHNAKLRSFHVLFLFNVRFDSLIITTGRQIHQQLPHIWSEQVLLI